jgi:serine/threonine-protein kinase
MTAGPLDPETWRRVDAVLDRALELPPGERTAFLEAECGRDPRVLAHVRELLAADDRASEFLERPVDEVAGDLLGPASADADALAPGAEVPPWRIVREIGRGGMGAVHLAERADGQFQQRAALKVIREGLRGGGFRDRFLQERRILARLEHPRIARLLDGGFLPDGRPWFAMEYVDGVPITEYADRERLSVEERTDLFADVCEAVAHAQRHLVVHRDLKPSNVLVAADGKPRLLDFGIAKIFAEPGGDEARGETADDGAPALAARALTMRRTALTRDGARLLTPEYAAPEQLRGEEVTTATDVWALGCILFELLCGSHPYASHRDTPGALEHAVLTGDSKHLPRAVTEPAAGARRTTTRALRRRLRGDLANIASRALARAPAARYATAADLGADLRNWRRGLPVTARAPSFGYRAAKAIARNRVAVGAAVAVLIALTAGLAAATWQARRAEREAERAVAVTEFLQSLFAETDPDRAQGEDPRASELLACGAERLETELADQPELRAELLQTIGVLYHRLGDYERAGALLRQALDLRTARFGSDDPRVAETLGHLGASVLAMSDYETADSLLTRALEIERRHRSGGTALSAAVGNLAAARRELGRIDETESLYREALAINRALHGPESEHVATDLSNLAVFLTDAGRLEDAESLHRDALAIRRKVREGDHTGTATSLANLGHVLTLRGKLDEAETALNEALAMRRKLFPDGHRHTASVLRALGLLKQRADDLAGADARYSEALAMSRRLLGESHFDVANDLNNLAIIAFFRRDFPAARERFADALSRFEQLLPEGHPTVLTVRGNLATVALEMGDVDAAEREYRASIATRTAALGEDHASLASDWRALGGVCGRRGRWKEAEDCYRRALAIDRRVHGDESEEAATDKVYLARPLAETGRAAEAESLAREAIGALAALLPDDHRTRLDADAELARVILRARRPAEALPGLEAALAARRASFGDDDRKTAEAAAWTGECLLDLGRRDEARALLEPAVRTLLATRGPEDPLCRQAQAALERTRP